MLRCVFDFYVLVWYRLFCFLWFPGVTRFYGCCVAVLLAITVLSAARWCLLRVRMFVVLFALALRALLVVVC